MKRLCLPIDFSLAGGIAVHYPVLQHRADSLELVCMCCVLWNYSWFHIVEVQARMNA